MMQVPMIIHETTSSFQDRPMGGAIPIAGIVIAVGLVVGVSNDVGANLANGFISSVTSKRY